MLIFRIGTPLSQTGLSPHGSHPVILWVDEILPHFEAMIIPWYLRGKHRSGFLRWCRISSIHSTKVVPKRKPVIPKWFHIPMAPNHEASFTASLSPLRLKMGSVYRKPSVFVTMACKRGSCGWHNHLASTQPRDLQPSPVRKVRDP